MSSIIVYTDGSSIANGKPECVGGWSCIFYMQNKMFVRYGHLTAPSSNNRAEITGVLYAISVLKDKKDWNIKIHSDSQYVVKSINEWRHGWKKRGYEGIKNSDLLIPLFNAWDEHGSAKIEWVRGHVGVQGNEMADVYAGYGSKNLKMDKCNDMVNIRMLEADWKSNNATTNSRR